MTIMNGEPTMYGNEWSIQCAECEEMINLHRMEGNDPKWEGNLQVAYGFLAIVCPTCHTTHRIQIDTTEMNQIEAIAEHEGKTEEEVRRTFERWDNYETFEDVEDYEEEEIKEMWAESR